MKYLLLSFVLFFQIDFASSMTSNVEIVKLKGYVSQLYLGSRQAKGLSLQDKLQEDTSILTGTKSMIRIKFFDNTEITVGSNSKIVLSDFKNKDFSSITLLKGRMRVTSLNNENLTPRINFFIKTINAVVGASTADYQVVYNSENKLTSILTFKGEVFLSKNDQRIQEKFPFSKTEILRDEESKNPLLQKVKPQSNNFLEIYNQMLNSQTARKVLAGQNSMMNNNFDLPTIPVKISLNQFQVLYKNNELEERISSDTIPFSKNDLPQYDVTQADQLAPVDGIKQELLGDYAPRAGGLIDFSSGLYVSPGRDSIFDSKNKIYSSEMIGQFDEKTGQYISPKGTTLHPINGFSLAEENNSQPQIHALAEDLNMLINKEVVLDSKFSEIRKVYDIDKKFLRDIFKVSIHQFSIHNNLNSKLANEDKLKSKNSYGFSLSWQMAAMSRFSPVVGLGFSKVDYDQPSNANISLNSKKLLQLSFGSLFSLNEFTDLFTCIKLDQDNYIDQTNVSTPYSFNFQKVVVAKLSAGINYEFFRNKKVTISTQFAGLFNFRKKINNFIVDKGIGYQLNIFPKYHLSNDTWVELGLTYESLNQRIRNSLIENRVNKTLTDLQVSYIFDY